MSATIAVEINHPELGKGRVELVCTAIPHDAFIPLAISKLGKDDQKMGELLVQILAGMGLDDEKGDDESQDEGR